MKVQELLIFEVSGRHLAVPLSVVEEVVPSSAITAVPSSPPFLLGLAGVRGKVVGVIDAARRYGLPVSLNLYFLVCYVRGNLTAITIDRAFTAGALPVRELSAEDTNALRSSSGLDSKFVTGAFEVFEYVGDQESPLSTGMRCLMVDPNLFVSAEMASRVGEAL